MKKIVSAITLMAVLGITFTSCEKKNEVQYGTADVHMGMSVIGADRAANAPQYAPADDVYFDGTNNIGIHNIYVVPMENDIAQKPTKLNDLNGGELKTSTATKFAINQTTNRFLVYANAGALPLDANFDLATEFVANEPAADEMSEFVKPHPVYLFADAKEENNNLDVMHSESPWTAQGAWESYASGMIFGGEADQKNHIKIKNVTYQVGTLAAALFHGDYAAKETKIKLGDTEAVQLTEELVAANIELMGITVQDQSKTLDYKFDATGDVCNIYEPMDNGNAAKTIKAYAEYENGKMTFNDAATKANTFVVVTSSNKETIVNFVFKNTSNGNIQFTNNDGSNSTSVIPAGGLFYIAATLKPGNHANNKSFMFAKGYTTMLNAMITNWDKATSEPQTAVDVEVGIEVDLTWKEGITFNEEI